MIQYTRLVQVIDNKVVEEFHGICPEAVEMLGRYDVPVFVTAGSANPIAEETFKKHNVKEYVVCYNHLYIVNGIFRTY